MRFARVPSEANQEWGRVEARLELLERRISELAERLEQSQTARERAERALSAQLESELRPLLVALVRDDPGHRRRLFAVRASADYELAYTERDPLVTIVIASMGRRVELLLNRALPSALAQTHANIEVLVVGDAAGEDLRRSIDALGDSRVRCLDLTQRYVHPAPHRHWLNGSTIPRNEGYGAARGRWISELDDDDALRPDAIADLLSLARNRRLEVAYGIMEQHQRGGETTHLGRFPPASADPHWREHGREYEPWDGTAAAAALVHAGLRFFAREHVAADIPSAGDYFRLERMVRAGVRFGMLSEVVYDYYPSNLWEPPPALPT